MSDDKKRRYEGGGDKAKPAESGDARESLSDCALNAWRGLRPALEVGAADSVCVASIELVSKEQAKVSLTLTNPRALEEEPLTSDDVKRLMSYELSGLSRERSLAAQRAPWKSFFESLSILSLHMNK